MKRIIIFIALAMAPVVAGYAQDTTPQINKKNLVVKEWNTNGKGVARTLDHVTTYSPEGKKLEEIEYDSAGKQKWRKRYEWGRTASSHVSWCMTSVTGWSTTRNTNTTNSGRKSLSTPTTQKENSSGPRYLNTSYKMTDTFATISRAIREFAPITLEEMEGVKLLNRIDTKYLTNEATLGKILSDAAAEGYRALVAEGVKISPYSSVYFDTPELRMFLDHHNRRLVRQKVRTRVYVNSGDAYLEIKRKNNHGRTKKKRIGISESEMMEFAGNLAACEYLARHSWFTVDDVSPVLSTEFERITLVNPARTERLTIDTRLHFQNYRTGKEASLEDAVIIELKQDGRAASQMKKILLDNRVKPVRVSKYCIAEALTDPSVKSNRFKVKVRTIEKTINKKIQVI